MKIHLTTLLLFFSLCAFRTSDNVRKATPNVVLIFADDLGYGDLASYGALFPTPNLDRLAAEGMRFTQFYAAQAVCSASRAALLTGCYPNRMSIHGALMPWSKNGLNPNEVTIAEMLKARGYATAIYGKWHLGWQQQFLPLQHGFDEYLGIPYSNDMWPVEFDGTAITDTTSWKFKYPPLPLVEGNQVKERITDFKGQDRLTTLYTERAVSFIRKNRKKPFFLYVPHSMPHVPLGVSEKFRGKSGLSPYADVIMEIDWSVGQIMAALKAEGLEDNTLVIFTSDNGPWQNFGNHAGSAGGLREAKGTSFEGGVKVPCIMRMPGRIPAGTVCHKLAVTLDIFPTVAKLAGGALPQHKIDGVDITPLLLNESQANPRQVFYYYYERNSLQAIRMGRWKLILPHRHQHYLLPKNDRFPGPTVMENTGLALFDLHRDPGERYDVQSLYPEVVKEMLGLAENARADLGDELSNRKGANVRDCGWAEN